MKLKRDFMDKLRIFIRPHGKVSFIDEIICKGQLLDVGCGNNSPIKTKRQRPDLVYTGVDIGDYNQKTNPSNTADKYILTSSSKFCESIVSIQENYDAVISSHNLEHCEHPYDVLNAMTEKLKIDGRIYLSFPCSASVKFPKRKGCLNFYDDHTHRNPLNFDAITKTLRSSSMNINFAKERSRPIVLFIVGLILEPLSYITKKICHLEQLGLYMDSSLLSGPRSYLTKKRPRYDCC